MIDLLFQVVLEQKLLNAKLDQIHQRKKMKLLGKVFSFIKEQFSLEASEVDMWEYQQMYVRLPIY